MLTIVASSSTVKVILLRLPPCTGGLIMPDVSFGSLSPVADDLNLETYAHCQCNFRVRRTVHDHSHNYCIVLRSPTTVWTCFHWWFDDGGWFLQFSIPPVIDVLTPATFAFAHCQCNFRVGRTAQDHSRIVLRSPSNTTVWTCFHWWFDDGGWFLQFSMPPVIDVLTPETFAYCQCIFVIGRTTCNHSHNRCIVLHSPSSVICLFSTRLHSHPAALVPYLNPACWLCSPHHTSFILALSSCSLSAFSFFSLIASSAFPRARRAESSGWGLLWGSSHICTKCSTVKIAIDKIDSSWSLSNNRSSAFSDSSSIFPLFFFQEFPNMKNSTTLRVFDCGVGCFPEKMSCQHPMWIKKVTLTCEVLVIPDATSMWNILFIENHNIGESLPA